MKSVARTSRFLAALRPSLRATTARTMSLRAMHSAVSVWAPKDDSSKSEQLPDLDLQAQESSSIPWYLRETAPLAEPTDTEAHLPPMPEDAPPELAELVKLAASEYGLSDIVVFDLRALPPDHPHSAANELRDFVVLATAKSERHVYKAASELKIHLKHTEQTAIIEGLVSTTPSSTARRRLLRRPNKGPMSTDSDFGKSANSWVMCMVHSVQMHILTSDRRRELDLESLWSEDYVEDELPDEPPHRSIRAGTWTPQRQLHTAARLHTSSLTACYNNLLEAEVTLSDDDVHQRIAQFEQQFNRPSLNDHHTRFLFYRALHLVRPDAVPFDVVADTILAKYDDLQLVLSQPGALEAERARDMAKLMKLLIDSPEYNGASDTSKATADKAYRTLSKLAKSLYQFSGVKINFGLDAEFIPLLLKLSFVPKTAGPELGPRVIDDVIYNNKDHSTTTFATSVQASNRTRDVLALVDDYTRTQEAPKTLSRSIKELILFSYGNAAKWDKFWDEWEVSFNLLAAKDDVFYKNWLRLVVYLGLRNDPVGNARFVTYYWSNSASISGSFVDFYTQNSARFTAAEKAALKTSLSRVAASVPTVNKSDQVRDFVNTL